jgi:hypothetical protein
MASLSELERQGIVDREGTNPVYPTQQKGIVIPADTTLADYIDTVSGDGFAKDSDLVDGSIDAVFNTIQGSINGTGTNFKVGDDVYIGDINVSNVMQVKGVQDATKGFIQFGSGSAMPKIGGNGANHLNISNIPAYANNAAALSGGLVAGDVYRLSDYLAIVH